MKSLRVPSRVLRTAGLAALLAAPLTLACSSSGGGALVATGEVLATEALTDALAPRPGEKAVVVNFWATWCPPCVGEMPELVELHENWHAKGVRVQTVALDVVVPQNDNDTPEEVLAFMAKRGFDVPVYVFDGDLTELAKRFQLTGALPTTIVLDATGEVVARREGAANYATFERMLEKAL